MAKLCFSVRKAIVVRGARIMGRWIRVRQVRAKMDNVCARQVSLCVSVRQGIVGSGVRIGPYLTRAPILRDIVANAFCKEVSQFLVRHVL